MSDSQRIVVIQHEERVPLGQLERSWPGAVTVVRADHGEPIPHVLDGIDGLVVLGAALGVSDLDKAPWLADVSDLMAAALREQIPTLGLCLGGQLLAEAAGGEVSLGSCGGEIGVVDITLTSAAATDRLAAALGRTLGTTFPVAQSHYDAVQTLPPGAALLASSHLYPHQLFRVGDCAWGTQYHPEVTPEWFADWMAADADALQQQGRTVDEALAEYDQQREQLAAVADAHAQAFAEVVGS